MKHRERLLNPVEYYKKRYQKDISSLEIKEIEGEFYRYIQEKREYRHSGMCQCFKDCDCAEKRGQVTITIIDWYRNVKFDGTDKCFYSEPYTPTPIN